MPYDADGSASPPPVPPLRRQFRREPGPTFPWSAMAMFLLAVAVLLLPLFVWFFCRIEPRAGEFAVLIRKTGKPLPSGALIAQEPGQKGIQLEVLPEGRYFRNPYTWGWRKHKVTDIPAGQLGVVTRLYGQEPADGQIIAGPGEKGILPDVLLPGKHRVNPYAFNVTLVPAITIHPGCVGVVTELVGADPINDEIPAAQRNTFLVERGLKGVIREVLDPGTYYLHPYRVNVVEVNLRSQRFEMSGADVISFLTLDGFTVTVEGTIEFALKREEAALITHRVGDMDDIIKKTILPRARGFSRIEGSKHPAIDFIVGETRQKFQNDLEAHLREKSKDWGVEIRSVLVRKITVPDQIAGISHDRQMAVQEARKYEQQIEQAKSEAELARQEMLAQQNKEKVEAETARIRTVINAQQELAVQVVAAEKDLGVAKLRYEAAAAQAAAQVARAEGERDAIRLRNEAEAGVLAGQVEAFGSGINLARYTFYQRAGPRIESVLTSDGKESLGSVFGSFLPDGKEVAR